MRSEASSPHSSAWRAGTRSCRGIRTSSSSTCAASTSGARANVPRNLTDAMLKAVARQGGAVCVNFGTEFLDERSWNAQRAIRARLQRRQLSIRERWRAAREEVARLPPVPLARLVDHIDHVAKVAGVDHVCLGSDFDGVAATPRGLENAAKLPALTAALRARGWAPADVEKILGGNVLRVLEANEP